MKGISRFSAGTAATLLSALPASAAGAGPALALIDKGIWFPAEALDWIATSPGGRSWAGASANYPASVALEGDQRES